MIWATVSSQSCFSWLYKASPPLAAKDNQSDFSIGHLVMSMVESSLVLLKEGVFYNQCILLEKLCWFWPVSFFTLRLNLPITPGVSWLSTFAYHSPIMKRISKFSFFSISGQGIVSDYCDIEWFALEINRDHTVIFEIASKYWISGSLVDYDGYSISSKGFLPTVVVIIIIWVEFMHSSPF